MLKKPQSLIMNIWLFSIFKFRVETSVLLQTHLNYIESIDKDRIYVKSLLCIEMIHANIE